MYKNIKFQFLIKVDTPGITLLLKTFIESQANSNVIKQYCTCCIEACQIIAHFKVQFISLFTRKTKSVDMFQPNVC